MSTDARPHAGVPIGPIVEVTVVVPDLDEAVGRYVKGFGWSIRQRRSGWGDERAARWRAPRLAHAPTVVLGPDQPAGAPGVVRLVEWPAVVPPQPLQSFGWTALELCVRDVEFAIDRAVRAGWTLLREPARLGVGRLPLMAGQVAAPSGEAVYLTQILAEVPGFDLPTARQSVDGVFIAVLGVPHLAGPRAVLERRFAVRRASDRCSPIGVLNAVFRLPADTPHRLSTLQLAGKACIEIDELPDLATPRPRPAGYLPGGLVGVSVATDTAHVDVLELPGGAVLELCASAAWAVSDTQ